ncbi:MAG: carboxypeptidase-like regulatory domain-containing protein [Bacteroidales bacterium]|nr:carboxypeptidase-like regulatory domain-containing protein [Bacteroidales bacterium]
MRICISLIFILLTTLAAHAQVQISGTVTDGKSPLVGAVVVDTLTNASAVTDAQGRFDLATKSRLPFAIKVRMVGYDEAIVELTSRESAQGISIVMSERQYDVDQVEVVGNRRGGGFQTIEANVNTVTPSVSGGIETVVKSQMGVSSNSELSSQYRVRGGNFDENMVYVGGVEIYRPFLIRSGEQEGLSFVNPDMISEVAFSAGGFSAAYSDGMASVLDVVYKSPKEHSGGARISLLGASAHFAGASKSGKLSHNTGLRYKTNQYMLGSLDTQGDYDPRFFDVQSYWTIRPSNSLTFNVLAYYAHNKYQFTPENRETTFGTISDARKLTIYFEGHESDTYKTAVGAFSAAWQANDATRLTLRSSIYRSAEEENFDILGEYWLQQASQSQSNTVVDQSENIGVGGYLQHARNELYTTISTFSLTLDKDIAGHQLSAQIMARPQIFTDYTDEWSLTDSAGYITSRNNADLVMDEAIYANSELNTSYIAGYLVDEYAFATPRGRLTLNAGLRFSRLAANGQNIVSPRLSLRYNRSDRVLRLAFGRYCQVPLFREFKQDDGSLNTDVKAQKSWQLLFGADLFFSLGERPFKFTTEAYYKWLSKINPYSIDNVRLRYMAENCADGYTYGIDFKLNGELINDLESWITLSLMNSKEDLQNDDAGYIPRPSDQRVSLSMVMQDCLPANKSVGMALNLYFASGLPFGPPNSERKYATLRMPGYKRVDLGLYKDFALNHDGSRKGRIHSARFGVDVFNLFDFSNTISYFWVKDTDGRNYAVPNYLTSRRLNVSFTLEF